MDVGVVREPHKERAFEGEHSLGRSLSTTWLPSRPALLLVMLVYIFKAVLMSN